MNNGDYFIIGSSDTLYKLSSPCSVGSTVDLRNETVVRYRLINNQWFASDNYTFGNYSNYDYYCNQWNDTYKIDFNFLILPAVIVVLAFFSIIFRWFIRLRG